MHTHIHLFQKLNEKNQVRVYMYMKLKISMCETKAKIQTLLNVSL